MNKNSKHPRNPGNPEIEPETIRFDLDSDLSALAPEPESPEPEFPEPEFPEIPASEEKQDKPPPAEPTAEELLAEAQDRYLRQRAEFDNFRKRSEKEKASSYSNGVAGAVAAILPALDNFGRALSASAETAVDEKFREGLAMILSQLTGALEKLGVKEIDALGAVFDPELHNAIKQVPAEEEGEEGEDSAKEPQTPTEPVVCEVFQKGYTLGDNVIRHAMVAVKQ